jgi:hypothetical protein
MDTSMSDLNCRVAKVEERLDGLVKDIHCDREDARRRSDRIFAALDELQRNAHSNKGFFGGVVFSVSAIFAFLAYIFTSKT